MESLYTILDICDRQLTANHLDANYYKKGYERQCEAKPLFIYKMVVNKSHLSSYIVLPEVQ